jgi:O-antigen ligase
MLALVLVLILLRPHPEQVPAAIAVYGSDLLLLAVLAFSFLRRGSLDFPRHVRIEVIGGILLLLVAWIATVPNLYRLHGAPDVVRFTVYGLVYLLLAQELFRNRVHGSTVRDWLDRIFVLTALIAVLQLLDPPIVGEVVRSVWGSEKLRSLTTGYPRVFASFYNANWFGVYLVFMLSIWLSSPEESFRTPKSGLWKLGLWVPMLFFSGSRTAVIGTIVVLALALPRLLSGLLPRLSTRGVIISTILVATLAAGGYQFLDRNDKLVERYVSFWLLLTEGKDDPSVANRLDLWAEGLATVEDRPWVGYGALEGQRTPHNSYIAVALAMGIPVTVLVLVGSGFLLLEALLRSVTSSASFYGAFFLFCSSLGVIAMSGEYFFATQVMLLWVLLLACRHLDDRENAQHLHDGTA